MNSKLEHYLAHAADDLPTIPSLAFEVMKAIEDPDRSIDDMRCIIERDPALSAQILRLANSSLLGFPIPARNISHAISIVGMRMIHNLVLSFSLKQGFKRFGFMESLLWEHSTLAGPLAARLASMPTIDLDRDDAFTAGLLHDIGKMALANNDHEGYERVVAQVYNEGIGFVEAERHQYGFDHTELGLAVARRWNLPGTLQNVIAGHHDEGVLSAMDEVDGRLTALTMITSACLTRLGVGRQGPVAGLDLAALPAWHFLHLEEGDVASILESSEDVLRTGRALMN
jgi:putative nucleotidyltransferase with HDIG domain